MGEPSLFPQGRYQAHQVDPQALPAQNHLRQLHLGHPALLAYRTNPCYKEMLGDLHRNHWDLNDFPGPLHPSAVQVGPAVGTDFHGMLHPPGRSHTLTGEAVAPWLSGLLFLR